MQRGSGLKCCRLFPFPWLKVFLSSAFWIVALLWLHPILLCPGSLPASSGFPDSREKTRSFPAEDPLQPVHMEQSGLSELREFGRNSDTSHEERTNLLFLSCVSLYGCTMHAEPDALPDRRRIWSDKAEENPEFYRIFPGSGHCNLQQSMLSCYCLVQKRVLSLFCCGSEQEGSVVGEFLLFYYSFSSGQAATLIIQCIALMRNKKHVGIHLRLLAVRDWSLLLHPIMSHQTIWRISRLFIWGPGSIESYDLFAVFPHTVRWITHTQSSGTWSGGTD